MKTGGLAKTNPLVQLGKQGQSVWLDYIRRSLIMSGELKRLVEEDGLGGLTSNPTIFEKAISGSADYDDALRSLLTRDPHMDPHALYEALTIQDIQMAADVLRPVYDRTNGADGFVSLEVSPNLAHDTTGTLAEARHLWKAVSKPNLMIKVPATPEGVAAAEVLISEGINVNVTLMFTPTHYETVAQAYLLGLKRCPDPRRVASVASFFVSRVDAVVDRALQEIDTPEALALRGKGAVANSRAVYRRFRDIFYGEPFAGLRERGARVQRVLWASTGTKDPAYPDVLYVEELIGPDTVNTMPPATLDAFRDHGQMPQEPTVEDESAQTVLSRLEKLGINLNAIGEKLQVDGVASFEASFHQLIAALQEKAKAVLAGQVDRQTLSVAAYYPAVQERLRLWQTTDVTCRLWRNDPTLWSPDRAIPEITDRLGWLTLPEVMHEQVAELTAFAEEIRGEGFRHVVLLGMGGSSLAPEVFQGTFGNARGFPSLIVLDSTHPDAVRAVESGIDLSRTLFLVSSKSGTTIEPLSFFRYFRQRLERAGRVPGRHFVAITDPGTPLAQLAREGGFRRVFQAPSDVGGRYSALTVFGLVPAALIGVDIHRMLERAQRMAGACAFCVRPSESPALVLGAVLGELALAGRNKVTFCTSRSLAALPSWIEQLIAESTGKDGKGIVPIADEPAGLPEIYGKDRLFVYLGLQGEEDAVLTKRLAALEEAGHPVVRILLAEKEDIGQEFFRWEMAVASAGAILGIHPFNQPDVESAKVLARQAMGAESRGRTDRAAEGLSLDRTEELAQALEKGLSRVRAGDYVAIQAYLAPVAKTILALRNLRGILRNRLRVATTLGYGPRFLHSTGQLHKGGPETGLFFQLVDDPAQEIPVPETDYGFGALIRAQALGDYQALRQRNRRVIRIRLGRDLSAGLRQLLDAIEAALSTMVKT